MLHFVGLTIASYISVAVLIFGATGIFIPDRHAVSV